MSKPIISTTDSMLLRSQIGKLRRLPGWVIFPLIAVLYTVSMLGRDYLTGEVLDPMRIAFTSVAGIAVSVIIYWLVRWQRARERKKPVGWPTVTNFRTALSSGQIPEGARVEQWVPELTKAIRQERRMSWIGMLMFTGFTGLGVFLTIDNPEHPWFWVIAAGLFAGLAVWYPIWTPRRRKKMQNLIAAFPDYDA
ncbi:hypothetical protein ABIB35_002880 [Arthrobacter sp. UYP6]|uniref:hypothetical protein n=1 Tax=Arthrobacter sp. UYP6 TaxID=1756378 RepID=UPI00339B57FB